DPLLIRSVAFSPDGSAVLTGLQAGEIMLWDVATGKPVRHIEGGGYISSVKFSPDGKTFAATSDDTTVRLWDVETGKHLRQFPASTDSVNDVAFSPDGRTIAAAFGTLTAADYGGTSDQSVRVWEVATGKEIHHFPLEAQVTGLVFSSDGQFILSSA